MDPKIRVEILNRAVPKLIKNFNGHKCTLYDEFEILCEDCPLNTRVGGLHCDMRAILAVLIDDMTNESKKKVPHIALEPFLEDGGVYKVKPYPIGKQQLSKRFEGII
jgi:hypothetical protein